MVKAMIRLSLVSMMLASVLGLLGAEDRPVLYIANPIVPPGQEVDQTQSEQVLLGLFDVLTEDTRLQVESASTMKIPGLAEAIKADEGMGLAIPVLQENKVRYLAWARFVNTSNGIVTVQAWILDTITRRILATAARTAPGDLAFSVHAVTLAASLAEDLKLVPDAVLSAIPEKPSRQFANQIVFTSPLEGMEVRDSHGRLFGTIVDGTLNAEFVGIELGHDLVLSLSKEGYWPSTRNYRVNESGARFDLGTLTPLNSFRLGAVWHANYPASLGVRADYFYNPDWQWLGAGASLLVQAFPLWSGKEDKEIMQFVLYPGLTMEVGTYVLTPPGWFVRTTLASRLGVVAGFTMTSDTRPSTDLYIQPLVIGLEVDLGTLVIRQESSWRWYLGLLPNSLFDNGYANTLPRMDLLLSWKWEDAPWE